MNRDLTTNPAECPEHGRRLVAGKCPVSGCDYDATEDE